MPKFLTGSYTLSGGAVTVALGYTLSTSNTVQISLQANSLSSTHYASLLTVTNFQANGSTTETGRWFAYVP